MSVLGKSKCWNCGSMEYYNTISIEACPSCGIRCDYHGGGSNEKYDAAMREAHYQEERRREDEERQYYEDTYGVDYRGNPV